MLMTREQYIKARQENSLEIPYMYYKEHFDKEKHKTFLEYPQFVEFLQMWPGIHQAFGVSVGTYDAKFNVLTIPLKDGKALFI